MAKTIYIKTGLTGGDGSDLDGIDGASLVDGDVCFVLTPPTGNLAYIYVLDDDSGAGESSPDVISPDSNAGNKRWILQKIFLIDSTAAGDMLYYSAANTIARLAAGATTEILVGGGAAPPVWTTATGTGAPVRAGAPTGTGQWTIPTIDLTGGQLAFPASQSASGGANTLDDYEEGSWDPTYNSTGGSFAYYIQTGSYTKIGRLVICSFKIATNASTVGSGNVTIGGLPFAAANDYDVRGGGAIGQASAFTGDFPSCINVIANVSTVDLNYRTSANGATTALQGADLHNGNVKNILTGSFYYFI